METSRQKIGNYIQALMNERRLMKKELAAKTRMPNSKISNFLNGKEGGATVYNRIILALDPTTPELRKADNLFFGRNRRRLALSYTPISEFAERLGIPLSTGYPVMPAINIVDHEIDCRVLPRGSCRFAPPADIERVIREVIEEENAREANSTLSFDDYRKRFQGETWAPEDEYIVDEKNPAFDVFRAILKDPEILRIAKENAFKDFLAERNGFGYNGEFFAVVDIKSIRDRRDMENFVLTLQETDYFSYRVISELAREDHLARYGLSDKMGIGIDSFNDYLANHFQRNIHLSMGLTVFVHTLNDDRVILTRRSRYAAQDAKGAAREAGKYVASANEGFSDEDRHNVDHNVIYMEQAIRRALEEELLGRKQAKNKMALPEDLREAHEKVINSISDMSLVGWWVYLPNMSINACFYVTMDCNSEDLRFIYHRARDAYRETTGMIKVRQWDGELLPEWSYTDIRKFIEHSLKDAEHPYEVWDEGALLALIYSAMACE